MTLLPRPLRVAVIGAGPAGLYAADHLTFDADGRVQVDVLERHLAAAVPPRAEYFYDDMHLSEAGARLVAQLVVGWVLELEAALPAVKGAHS